MVVFSKSLDLLEIETAIFMKRYDVWDWLQNNQGWGKGEWEGIDETRY